MRGGSAQLLAAMLVRVRHVDGFELSRILVPAQVARLGLTPARVRTELRRGNWQRLAPGVLLTRPDEPTRDDWAHVGVHLAGPASALSGWDALRANGLGGRLPPDPTVLVLTPRGANRVLGGVRVRRTSSWLNSTRVRAIAAACCAAPSGMSSTVRAPRLRQPPP